jgi:CPA2 family monovalent cation:H+ antiporter-2
VSNFEILLIVLGISVVIVSILRRIHLPPILGYLIAGACIGPYGLALLETKEEIRTIAEFGVVFLLFSIGLELSLPKLISMRRALLGLGGLQVLICTLVAMFVAKLCGLSWAASFAVAGALALSSTAVVTKQLVEQDELDQAHGKMSLAILLFQDLATVPFLIIVPAMANTGGDSIGEVLLTRIGIGVFIFTIMLAAGRWLLRPLFHHIAQARSSELFMLTALLVVLGAAFLTEHYGLSAALGAFLAGVMLGETEYAHQIESDIQPFRDILLGFFFISIGLMFDLRVVMEYWPILAAIIFALMVFKFILIAILARLAGSSLRISMRTGLILAQGGEFGLFLVAVAFDQNILAITPYQIMLASIVMSMAISPLLIRNSEKIANKLAAIIEFNKKTKESDLATPPKALGDHVIICGYGRVGQTLARFLEYEGIPYVGIDVDPSRLIEAKTASEPVFFGDPAQENVLIAANILEAKVLIIAFNHPKQALKVLKTARRLNKEIPIIVRTTDDRELESLQIAGATEVIPDKLESSLMMASHMLIMLGQSPLKAQQQVWEVKANRYKFLRGFYESTNIGHLETTSPEKKYLHAVELTEGAYAIGRTLEEFMADKKPITLTSFSRHGYKCSEPTPYMQFMPGDVLVIEGNMEEIYQMEEKLLQG